MTSLRTLLLACMLAMVSFSAEARTRHVDQDKQPFDRHAVNHGGGSEIGSRMFIRDAGVRKVKTAGFKQMRKKQKQRAAPAAAHATPAPIGALAKLEAQVEKPLGILVDKAREYIGKTARQLGLPDSLWCSDFVNMITGGGTNDRMARSWLRRPRMPQPELGAIVVLRRGRSNVYGHVGVLVGWDKHGNPIAVTGNSAGNRVREGRYDKSRVLAYVMPPLPRPQGLLEAGGSWVYAAAG